MQPHPNNRIDCMSRHTVSEHPTLLAILQRTGARTSQRCRYHVSIHLTDFIFCKTQKHWADKHADAFHFCYVLPGRVLSLSRNDGYTHTGNRCVHGNTPGLHIQKRCVGTRLWVILFCHRMFRFIAPTATGNIASVCVGIPATTPLQSRRRKLVASMLP